MTPAERIADVLRYDARQLVRGTTLTTEDVRSIMSSVFSELTPCVRMRGDTALTMWIETRKGA